MRVGSHASDTETSFAEIVEKIPKSPSGKILRRVLIERERTAVTAR